MKALDTTDTDILKEEGYTDKEIEIISWIVSQNERKGRYDSYVQNSLFGSGTVYYNYPEYKLVVYTRLGKIEIPTLYELMSGKKDKIKHTFDVLFEVRDAVEHIFKEKFFSLVNEEIQSEWQRVVNSIRTPVPDFYVEETRITVKGYEKIKQAIEDSLADIDFVVLDENGKEIRPAFNEYDLTFCILDALKEKFNLVYTRELKDYIYENENKKGQSK
jgi:predicted nucleotidyltransferase